MKYTQFTEFIQSELSGRNLRGLLPGRNGNNEIVLKNRSFYDRYQLSHSELKLPAYRAGLPEEEVSFILCPLTPPTRRGGRATFRPNEGLFFMALRDVRLSGYIPGAIGRVAELHGTYYHQHWGFHLFFESKVAIELSEFLRRFNEARDGFWVARIEEKIAGSIAIDGVHHDNQGAHLRWFIIAPENQGQGIGNRLLNEAIGFCRKKKYGRIYLWTFAGLDPARHLYEKFGFKLCEEHKGEQWGKAVTEQRFELIL